MHYKVAIVGGGRGGQRIYRTLRQSPIVEIVGMSDINPAAAGFQDATEDGIFVTTNFLDLIRIPGLNIVVEATGNPVVREKLHHRKPAHVAVMEGKAAELMVTILDKEEQLRRIHYTEAELSALFDSMQEAVEVADVAGVVQYVNPAFTAVTGVKASERVGVNIFAVSPAGALAECLRKRAPVSGKRVAIGGTGVRALSYAAPIVVDGQMVGGIVAFQPLNDAVALTAELHQRNRLLVDMTAKYSQVTDSGCTFDDVVGFDGGLARVAVLAKQAANGDGCVLISGEVGVGKEFFARAIHNESRRRDGPFIKINCAAVPEALLESELFGYEKDAFNGAGKTRFGQLELACGGTAFFYEIGDMPLPLQAKLVQVMEQRSLTRLGGRENIAVDVRVIAATNRNLAQLVEQGRFHRDLYDRLRAAEVELPPLRKRKRDIPALVNRLILRYNRLLGKTVLRIAPDALDALMRYDWPANVQELAGVLQRAMVLCEGHELTIYHLGPLMGLDADEVSGANCLMPLAQVEERLIRLALKRFGTCVEGKRRAAQALGISLATLYNKLRKFNL